MQVSLKKTRKKPRGTGGYRDRKTLSELEGNDGSHETARAMADGLKENPDMWRPYPDAPGSKATIQYFALLQDKKEWKEGDEEETSFSMTGDLS